MTSTPNLADLLMPNYSSRILVDSELLTPFDLLSDLEATANDPDEHTELILVDQFFTEDQIDAVAHLDQLVRDNDLADIALMAPTTTDTAYRHASNDSRGAFILAVLFACLTLSTIASFLV